MVIAIRPCESVSSESLEPDWLLTHACSAGILWASEQGSNSHDDPPSDSKSPSEEAGAHVRPRILIVEDNVSDVFLIREAIAAGHIQADIEVVSDGEKAIHLFDTTDATDGMSCPSLVILDINLPRKNGGEVLVHMRKTHKCSNVLVIAISTSDAAQDRERMYQLGANHYFRKPGQYREFLKLGDIIRSLMGSFEE